MEAAIWVIAIVAVIVVIVIYIITSVGSYSNTFIGKVFKDKNDKKEEKFYTKDKDNKD